MTDKDFYFPSTGVSVEKKAVLLSIDNYLLPLRDNLCSYLSTPECRQEPVLSPSQSDRMAPDQLAAHFYGAVLFEEGKYRMWYYANSLEDPDAPYDREKHTIGPVCYAESVDGIAWEKPSLGQVEFRGSKDNNAIALPDEQTEGVHVIRDESDPDPQRLYKMVYNAWNGKTWVFRTATSSDGIDWKAADTFAIDDFLETGGLYKFNDLYVVNGQRILYSDGGHRSGRQGNAVLSPNFDDWIPGHTDAFLLPEPEHPADRGHLKPYDQVHVGVSAASFGNVLVGLYGIWHNAAPYEEKQDINGWFAHGRTSCDLGLVISNDGLHFREPVKGKVYISQFDTQVTPIPGKRYPTVLVQSGNGILNVGDETRIYHGRWRNSDYGQGYLGEVALAILPRDRWGAIGIGPSNLFPEDKDPPPPKNSGSVWSAPVRLPASGCQVILNAEQTSGLRVEISDENFQLLPDYSGDQSGKSSQESGLDCVVEWPAGDLLALSGKTVRVKINFEKKENLDPRLFALYLIVE
ncbi:MAG: hypothetical protein JKY51_02120 [Opitutaceae bacterium]|nr:hypothetical protein [Opitutaceae bacterium]